MNEDMILRVADAIEFGNIPWLGFNMNAFFVTDVFGEDRSPRDCGTVACIAGWTIAVADNMSPPASDLVRQFGRAAKILDLSPYQSDELFFGSHAGIELWDITPSHAARVMRHLAQTGQVDWRMMDE